MDSKKPGIGRPPDKPVILDRFPRLNKQEQQQEVVAMTSNQDPKQNKLSVPMTGIEVMNDLSLDAKQMFHLVREGVLLPYYPKDLFRLNLHVKIIA